MTSTATVDRSEFRHILVSGTIVGAITAASVIVYLLVARLLPPGIVTSLIEAVIVLVGGVCATFLPASFATSRTVQGIAGAAAIGLWGTIVFMAVDIIVLRPFKAYPWTWDAVAGGSTWWYLPVWWMLGTFLAWVGAAVLALVASLVKLHVYLPVAAGGGFAIVLTLLALVALSRKG